MASCGREVREPSILVGQQQRGSLRASPIKTQIRRRAKMKRSATLLALYEALSKYMGWDVYFHEANNL